MATPSGHTRSELADGRILPLLRWAGGKQRMVELLVDRLPDDFRTRLYVEPFLGAASLYLAAAPREARLSDMNRHLIECYSYVRRDADAVARCLAAHRRHHCTRHYYRTRDAYNGAKRGCSQAARFIYLNRTGFNGIFRVNQMGLYNVPYGYKASPPIPGREHLHAVGKLLRRATLRAECFRDALSDCPKRSFVYLDPPYPPLNGTAYFTHYTADRFGPEDQESLASVAQKLHRRGILFLMTNADTPTIRRLYRHFNVERVPVTRFVTCRDTKHKVGELIVRNY